MKRHKSRLLVLITIAVFVQVAEAQEVTTQGKEFWLSFMGNGFKNNGITAYVETQVLVSAKRGCTGTISNPYTGWSKNFRVEANDITTIDIPLQQGYNETTDYEIATYKGLQIVTTDTVSVYCTNVASNSFDATYVLPLQALGDDYIIQTYDQSTSMQFGSDLSDYLTSAFLIVAVEDNTTVDITPRVKTLRGMAANEEFSVTLQAGEAYQVRSHNGDGSRDLSGSRVTTRDCKPIAVFNGNTLTTIPDVSNGYDHIFEQAMPVRSWGRKFVVTASTSRRRDLVKIVSAADDNAITIDGTPLTTLQEYESYSFFLNSSDASCYLESASPCAVYLYNTTSSDDDKAIGDPSMLWIAPIEQRLNEITFATFSGDEYHNSSIDDHYVNIIVASDDIDKVYFDHVLIPSQSFNTVNGNADYSFVSKSISHSAHHISCTGGFNAQVYGFGMARGYAYLVGSKATDLSTTLVIDEEVVLPNDTIGNCHFAPITFMAEINFANHTLLWDFGDGTTSTDNPVTHTYTGEAIYPVTLTVTTQEVPCQGSASTASVIYIDTHQAPDEYHEEQVCQGQRYTGHGFSNVLITADTLLSREEILPYSPDCAGHINVAITCLPAQDTFFVEQKCDSTVWLGKTYTQSGHYSDTIVNDSGCDIVAHLDLDIDYSPSPTPIYPVDTDNPTPHWVVTATEFQINTYDFELWDENPVCRWDTVCWEFESIVPWLLEPYGDKGKKCKLYVTNIVEDTVWLKATVTNGCEAGHGIERRYWLVSSFYGIEENGPSTGSGTSSFNVVPNPNNGEMSICFGDMEGQIAIAVYDMRGKEVDRFKLEAAPKSTHSYAIKGTPSGIYLFVFNQNGRIFTKKVIITN